MKVLLLNGSPRANGNTAAALKEMKAIFDQEGIEAEIVQVGHLPVRGCIANWLYTNRIPFEYERKVLFPESGESAHCDFYTIFK